MLHRHRVLAPGVLRVFSRSIGRDFFLVKTLLRLTSILHRPAVHLKVRDSLIQYDRSSHPWHHAHSPQPPLSWAPTAKARTCTHPKRAPTTPPSSNPQPAHPLMQSTAPKTSPQPSNSSPSRPNSPAPSPWSATSARTTPTSPSPSATPPRPTTRAWPRWTWVRPRSRTSSTP